LKITENYKIINRDVIKFLQKPPESTFDIIFADPPFTKQMADEVMATMSASALFAPNTIMAIESARKEKLEKEYGDLICSDQREFGDKILSFFTRR
jgi:16S rRNA (guanine966-N2)-methyltransferase